MRLVDTDALIEDLQHDVELDARALDSSDLVGDREVIQFDKDCKQNCIDLLRNAPAVETVALSTCVLVEHEALTAPWCEQYVKDMMARELAHELVNRIEIRSFDTDLRRMQKEFMGRVVIVTGAKMAR